MTANIMCVTYNRLPLTKQTFDSLCETTDYPFNLIVIDNASSDGTKEYLESLKLECKYLKQTVIRYNSENKGIAVGRNQGLVEANKLDGEWLVTLDNDVILPNGWLSECIDVLENNPTYAACGVNFEDTKYPLVTKNGVEFQNKSQGNLGTACMCFNKKIHKLIGFFNTSYGHYGLEDADYGLRLRAIKLQLCYLKENGNHIGSGENDKGEYRKWKTETHDKFLKDFNANCAAYYNRTKPIYIPFKEE